MGLINYTTRVPHLRSVDQIVSMLRKANAHSVTQKWDGFGNVESIEFALTIEFGKLSFRLPANVAQVLITLKRQAEDGVIPKRFSGDIDHARRVAWRIMREWIEVQMALIEVSRVKPDQAFLAYTINPQTGQTVYEMMIESKFERLALPAPKT